MIVIGILMYYLPKVLLHQLLGNKLSESNEFKNVSIKKTCYKEFLQFNRLSKPKSDCQIVLREKVKPSEALRSFVKTITM